MLKETELNIVNKKVFLNGLRKIFPISHIYYPGCGEDDVLETAFTSKEIVYLDNDYIYCHLIHRGGSFVLANVASSPFRTDSFDAVFIQDVHPTKVDLQEILRTLRPQRLVIFSLDDCENELRQEEDVELMETTPNLTGVILPFINNFYRVFQKTA